MIEKKKNQLNRGDTVQDDNRVEFGRRDKNERQRNGFDMEVVKIVVIHI